MGMSGKGVPLLTQKSNPCRLRFLKGRFARHPLGIGGKRQRSFQTPQHRTGATISGQASCQSNGLQLSSVEVEHCTLTRRWARVGWMCAVILLLTSSVQAAHICGLQEEFGTHHGDSVWAENVRSGHTPCTICASSHSPSLATQLVPLPFIDSPPEPFLPGRVIKHSAPQAIALYVRPPPVV